jgi:hypothetical protein
MNEIDEIKFLNMTKEAEETLNLWKKFSKYLDIIKNRIEFTNDELDELIVFFEKREYFKQCENLKKLKFKF